jgi:hypothetical protein
MRPPRGRGHTGWLGDLDLVPGQVASPWRRSGSRPGRLRVGAVWAHPLRGSSQGGGDGVGEIGTDRAVWFLTEVVTPTVAEFAADPGHVRRAVLAAIVVNHAADYLFAAREHLRQQHRSVSALREALGEFSFAFRMVRDVADAAKHVELNRISAELRTVDGVAVYQADLGVGLEAFDAPGAWVRGSPGVAPRDIRAAPASAAGRGHSYAWRGGQPTRLTARRGTTGWPSPNRASRSCGRLAPKASRSALALTSGRPAAPDLRFPSRNHAKYRYLRRSKPNGPHPLPWGPLLALAAGRSDGGEQQRDLEPTS